MEHSTQVELIERVLSLVEKKTTHMVERDSTIPTSYYYDKERFDKEVDQIFKQYPIIAGQSSQLKNSGDYFVHEFSGTSVLIVRDKAGKLNAFLNVCRHRGTKLILDHECGNKNAFVCPYHGWTYDQNGKLIILPHQYGFPGIDCEKSGLVALPVAEEYGLIWVKFSPPKDNTVDSLNIDVKSYLGPLARDFESFAFGKEFRYQPVKRKKDLNWKLTIDIFLEGYHVKQAHRTSIYPLFFDNIGIYDRFDCHLRNIFPKRDIGELAKVDKNDWKLRIKANILYYIFPNCLILVQPDHSTLFTVFPDGIDSTVITTTTLLPSEPETEKAKIYWQKNIDILTNATEEDFAMGESIQKSLKSGANEHMNFGRFEQSLAYFHNAIEEIITKK